MLVLVDGGQQLQQDFAGMRLRTMEPRSCESWLFAASVGFRLTFSDTDEEINTMMDMWLIALDNDIDDAVADVGDGFEAQPLRVPRPEAEQRALFHHGEAFGNAAHDRIHFICAWNAAIARGIPLPRDIPNDIPPAECDNAHPSRQPE